MAIGSNQNIDAGLRRIRARRRRVLVLLLGFLPVMWLTSFVFKSGNVSGVVTACYATLLLYSAVLSAFSNYPKCGNTFCMSSWSNPFAQRCMNCGLPLSGEPHSAVSGKEI